MNCVLFVVLLLVFPPVQAEVSIVPAVDVSDTIEVPEPAGTTIVYDGSFLQTVFVAHLRAVAEVPVEFGNYTYIAATSLGLDPYDLAALLISEHSGPDIDFSFETTKKLGGYGVTYDTDSVGSHGEIGLFQQGPYWARQANKFYGTDWTGEDLYDPWVNTQVAAYQMKHAVEAHAKKCAGKKSNLHDWVAHWKCATKARDSLRGQCRWAQKKFEKLRFSLTSFEAPDLRAIGSEHNRRVEKKAKKYEKQRQERLLKQVRKLWKQSGLSFEDPVWTAVEDAPPEELLLLIRNLEADLGYFDEPDFVKRKKAKKAKKGR